jgi:hypothetical protein
MTQIFLVPYFHSKERPRSTKQAEEASRLRSEVGKRDFARPHVYTTQGEYTLPLWL